MFSTTPKMRLLTASIDNIPIALRAPVGQRQPAWADTAWAEKASPAVQEATEAATRAMVETQEVTQPTRAAPGGHSA